MSTLISATPRSAAKASVFRRALPRTKKGIFFSSFSERPKHLDPARSYSSNEWAFISQVYEPPLQYHYLRRPYVLVPLTAASMPEIRHYAADGSLLVCDAERGLLRIAGGAVDFGELYFQRRVREGWSLEDGAVKTPVGLFGLTTTSTSS